MTPPNLTSLALLAAWLAALFMSGGHVHILPAFVAVFATGLMYGLLMRDRDEPEPSPEERDPDYCFIHQKIERPEPREEE